MTQPPGSFAHPVKTAGLAALAVMVVGSAVAPAAASASIGDGRHGAPLQRVSVASGGGQADADSFGASVSADGRLVAFSSGGTTLVPGDTNGHEDVFVRDVRSGRTTRVSVAADGAQAQGYDSRSASISADGRYVAFHSRAGNLVPGDANDATDVFVRDLWTRRTERVSLRNDGTEAAGGRGRASGQPSISADGRYVAFIATFPDLVPGDTNDKTDVFVRDRRTRRSTRVSVATGGAQANGISVTPSISGDGRRVAFTSSSADLVAGDTNGATDIFVHELRGARAGRTERVSVGERGRQSTGHSTQPAFSTDGDHVAFTSGAPDLVAGDTNAVHDVFVRDLRTGHGGRTERVSVNRRGRQGDAASGASGLSADGRYVAFASSAADLVDNDTNQVGDVFLRDRRRGTTLRLSIGPTGVQGNGHYLAATPAVSAWGRTVVFESAATNLVTADTNRATDIFLRHR